MTNNLLQLKQKTLSSASVEAVETFVQNAFSERKKSLGFTSTHYMSQQQKAILHAVHFSLKLTPNLKIAVVSFSLLSGYFQELIQESTPVVEGEKFSYKSKIDFINWDAVIKNQSEYEIVEQYDLIFWELPEIEYISANQKILMRSFSLIDSLAIVSKRLELHSKDDFRSAIDQYFQVHGLKIEAFHKKEKISSQRNKRSVLRRMFRRAG